MPLPGEFTFQDDGQGLYPDFSRTLSFIAYETYGIDFDQGLYDSGEPVPFLPAVSAGTVGQYGSVIEEGRMNEINLGASVEAARNVLVGGSINIPFSRYTFTRRFEEDDIYNDNDGTNGTTDFSYLDFTEWYQSDIVGVNARLGISALLSPGIRLGAVFETPTYVSVQDDYSTDLYTEFDNGDAFEYGDDSNEDAGSGTFDYDILTPWRAGIGLSYRTSGLTLMGDAEWVDWSQLELRSKDVSFADENLSIRQNFDSIVNGRLGASYDTGDLTIRAGLAYYPDPRSSRYLGDPSGSSLDRDRRFFSLGLGYRISDELRIDAAWMQERYDDVYRPYIEVDGAPWVEEQITRNRFQIGLSVVM
jgi:long-subunit fatty acid transport protein